MNNLVIGNLQNKQLVIHLKDFKGNTSYDGLVLNMYGVLLNLCVPFLDP